MANSAHLVPKAFEDLASDDSGDQREEVLNTSGISIVCLVCFV